MNGTQTSATLSPPDSPVPPSPLKTVATAPKESLFLRSLPAIFVSLTHFEEVESNDLEDRLHSAGASLSFDPAEIRLVVSKVERKRRAEFDLRAFGIKTLEVTGIQDRVSSRDALGHAKDEDATESESETDGEDHAVATQTPHVPPGVADRLLTPTVKVLRASWMAKCLDAGELVPLESGDLIYEGERIGPEDGLDSARTSGKRKREVSFGIKAPPPPAAPRRGESILERARQDALETSPRRDRDRGTRRFGEPPHAMTSTAPYATGARPAAPLRLLQQTTSEYEGGDGADADLPPLPEQHPYSCQRSTPAATPNDAFLALLEDVRLARLLTGDEIGVRAYSTAIAAIAAYPHPLSCAREVLRLPGCDVKIANLLVEYRNTGTLAAAAAARADPDLAVLRLFFGIWGVGAATARDFFTARGWRDLDDVVEFGWAALSRVQQIGVKFYAEFQAPIPAAEVEFVAGVVRSHAEKVRDGRVQTLIVGGHRRGKEESGDVDVLVSHPDEEATRDLVTDVVNSLEGEEWITHTLLLSLTSTHRGQETLPFRASKTHAGSGFDTLDKALVVWRDPKGGPHRRVDIIVSPWKTVGCAVAGWSGGTTFQRDLRRYAKNVKNWKFDSSGVRDRSAGMAVDLQGHYGPGSHSTADGLGVIGNDTWTGQVKTMEEAERRVFKSLGLEWRAPWERCTG